MNRNGLSWEKWEEEKIRELAHESHTHYGRVRYREIADRLGRSAMTVKGKLYQMGILISQGRVTMCDPEDEMRMEKWRREIEQRERIESLEDRELVNSESDMQHDSREHAIVLSQSGSRGARGRSRSSRRDD